MMWVIKFGGRRGFDLKKSVRAAGREEKTMADLESSWQESVIKLAQTGNLRAIAFWLNRYLVPQGICAQVSHEQPGSLLVRVVCHRPPERERLVRFICHRLCKLNAAGIQEAHITAQIVGSPTLLWEKSVRIAAAALAPTVSGQPSAEQLAFMQSLPGQPTSGKPLSEQPSSEQISAAQPLAQPPKATPKPAIRKPVSASKLRSAPKASPVRLIPAQFLSRLHRTAQLTIHQTVRQFAAVGRPPVAATPDAFGYANASYSGSGEASQLLPRPVKRQIRRSLRWFLAFPPHVRILLLAGAISAAFLVGSAIHALTRLQAPRVLPESSEPATFGKRKFSLGASNQVWTALESVPVIRQPVVNPGDPAVTLLFANSAALGRVSQNSARRSADMVITSLDQLPPVAASSSALPSVSSSPVPLDATAIDAATIDAATIDAATIDAATEPPSDAPPDSELESPVKGLSLPAMTIPDLPANGVDIVNLANGGLTEGGVTALAQAKELLNKNAVYAIGAGQTPHEARRPIVVDVKGQRIAYLGYANPPQAADGISPVGVNAAMESQIAEDIRAVRDQVDWVIVTYQWSEDPKSYPEDWQVKLAHLAVEQGADLVVGNGSGISQGGEVYQGRAIAYSLGSSMSSSDTTSPALKVTLLNQEMKIELVPMQAGQPAANATEIVQKFKQSSSLFDQPLNSPTVLDGQVRLNAAPQSAMPATDPFVSYPTDQAPPEP
jgi:Bacterial capsule synthesis protein PGA_cap